MLYPLFSLIIYSYYLIQEKSFSASLFFPKKLVFCSIKKDKKKTNKQTNKCKLLFNNENNI